MESNSDTGSRPSLNIAKRTEQCIELIKQLTGNEPANVIILLGRTGVGKSSLLEYLTGAVGHSGDANDPVTKKYQIEQAIIKGKQYFFMDTPGIDEDEQDTFYEVVKGIQDIICYARIVGLLYVTMMDHSRADVKLLEFLKSFCGEDYLPSVTFVTTHWTASEDWQRNKKNKKLEDLKTLWKPFLEKGAKLYQHGREYNDQGLDTGASLSWYDDRAQIEEFAKDMIYRHYSGEHLSSPLIVRELSDKTDPSVTSAASSLGIPGLSRTGLSEAAIEERTTQGPQQYNFPTTEEFQPEQEPSQSTSANASPGMPAERESSPGSPPARDEMPQQGGGSSQTSSPETNQPDNGGGFFQSIAAFFRNADIRIDANVASFPPADGGPKFSSASGTPRSYDVSSGNPNSTRWDPNSVVDFMKSQGIDSSRANRDAFAARHGINAGCSGSKAQNIAIHEALRNGRR